MLIFLLWAFCCIAAVLARRYLVWAGLCTAALAIVSFGWLARTVHDGFGFEPWGLIALFCGVGLVIAATSVLGIVKPLLDEHSGRGAAARLAALNRRRG